MRRIRTQIRLGGLLAGLLLPFPVVAQHEVYFRGRVVREDGASPDHMVTVQRVCAGLPQPIREAVTSRKTGEYIIRLLVSELGHVYTGSGGFALLPCSLEAVDSGYVSSRIDLTDRRITLSPRLPDLLLTTRARSLTLDLDPAAGVPRAATRHWRQAVRRLAAQDWDSAETPLRAVVLAAPKFAPAYAALGNLCMRQGNLEEARQALERAVQLDARQLTAYQMLAQVLVDLKDWPAVATTTDRLIAVDNRHIYVEAFLFGAAAGYQMRDYDKAIGRIDDAIRLDRLRELKRADYIRGLILEAKGDIAAAEQSLKGFLARNPRAKETAAIQERLAHLGNSPAADLSTELSSQDLVMAATGEAPVPGGIKAFSAVAQLPGTPSPHDFFLEYSRAMIISRPDQFNRTREAREAVISFISAVAALERLGERGENSTTVTLSTSGDEEVRKTKAILTELGLKLVSRGDAYTVEGAGLHSDGLRQRALTALGVDELELRKAVHERRDFGFAIPRETARLVGGAAWSVLLKGVPEAAGGPAEIFIRDMRFARVYRGLGAMDPDSAAALVSAIGLANLIVKHAHLVATYADSIEISSRHVAVPGGEKAEPVWARLVGANPHAPAAFLRALIEKDQGRMVSFYHALAHAGAPQQQFITLNADRAEGFYKWYRESALPPGSILGSRGWHQELIETLRIDGSGKVVFPGSRDAWGPASEPDDSILLHRAPLEALTAIIRLERERGTPLSGPAARLLAAQYSQWRNLFGYFRQLPGLDVAALRALQQFSTESAQAPPAQRNLLLGQWHSLVELIVLSSQAGTLNAGQAEEAFRRACIALRAPNPSAAALAILRSTTGSTDSLDEAITSRMLRLSGPRRRAFDELRKLQAAPQLPALEASPEAERTLLALSGLVYAATLDPASLLVAEDRQLLRKHRFVGDDGAADLFPASALAVSNGRAGSHFEGGFASFRETAEPLRSRTAGTLVTETNPGTTAQAAVPGPSVETGAGEAAPEDSDLVFQARGRVVEVYATVTDDRGRYIDNLKGGQFTILEEGEARPVLGFESHMAGVSVALVFDTTGSMESTLPWLKSAALQLLDELRPVDSVAVYTFDDKLTLNLPFTQEAEAAKRAILTLSASGTTALYEALVRVNHDLATRTGKKVMVVFTDGADNSSMLSSEVAIESARERGIPIYTIAQGEALLRPELVAQLNHISHSTGGTPFLVRKLGDIAEVFGRISQDLHHGYQLAFQPSPGENHAWRKIEVVLTGSKALQVRAREGYYVE